MENDAVEWCNATVICTHWANRQKTNPNDAMGCNGKSTSVDTGVP